MPWWPPSTWFSRSATEIKNATNSSTLRNALTNYIKAVNSLKPNGRTNQAITNLLNQANGNATNKRVIRNRLANGVAKIVIASRRAMPAAAEAAAGLAPVGAAVAAVNNATSRIRDLNNFMAKAPITGTTGGNAVALRKYYENSGRSYNTNSNTNSKRNGGARYASLWEAMKPPQTAKTFEELPGANIELTRNAFLPDNNSRKAKLVRNSGNSNWRFVNAANAEKYNINRKNKNDPVVVVKGAGVAVNKSKAAANLLYTQAYGGALGVGLRTGAWTVNKSVLNLTNTNNKMARFIGLNRAVVNANLNAKPNKGQSQRAKAVLNAIIQKQKAVPGN